MTDLTDQDRRKALAWAGGSQAIGIADAAARVILATVDAPAPTLAERLHYRADLLDNGDPDGDTPRALRDLATDAAQMEHDLAEASAEVEHLTAVNENLRRTDNFREFLGVQKGAESNAESIDPADVKPGEAWIVETHRERRTAVKDRDDYEAWNTFTAGGLFFPEDNEDITLVSRLVPAPRVITTREELDALPRRTVIRDKDGVVCERASIGAGWYTTETTSDQTAFITLPATVLWAPEETK